MSDLPALTDIETCSNYNNSGESRHRWVCLDCGARGPAEVDGRAARQQAALHKCAKT